MNFRVSYFLCLVVHYSYGLADYYECMKAGKKGHRIEDAGRGVDIRDGQLGRPLFEVTFADCKQSDDKLYLLADNAHLTKVNSSAKDKRITLQFYDKGVPCESFDSELHYAFEQRKLAQSEHPNGHKLFATVHNVYAQLRMLPSSELSANFRWEVERLAREEDEDVAQTQIQYKSTHYATEMTLGTAAGHMIHVTAEAANSPQDIEEITTALRNTAYDDPETVFSTLSDRLRGNIKGTTSILAGAYLAFKHLDGKPPAKPLDIVPLDLTLRPVHELVTKDHFPELTDDEIIRAKNRIRNNAMKGCVGLKETSDQATSEAATKEEL